MRPDVQALAIATLGEPSEWAARVVLALARLPQDEGHATRRVLEEGLEENEIDMPVIGLTEMLAEYLVQDDKGQQGS